LRTRPAEQGRRMSAPLRNTRCPEQPEALPPTSCPAPTACASRNPASSFKQGNPAPFYLNPPPQRHSREGGRERSDRRSKSRQHNLQDLLSSEPGENPPSKGDSLANAFSRARQEDVYNGQHYRYAPNTPRASPHTASNTGQPTRKHVLPPTSCLAPTGHPTSTT